jgi:hypothetical protein
LWNKVFFGFWKEILRKIIKKAKLCCTSRDSNRQHHECMSKVLRFEPAWSIRIIAVWPKKTLAAVTAVEALPLEYDCIASLLLCPKDMH